MRAEIGALLLLPLLAACGHQKSDAAPPVPTFDAHLELWTQPDGAKLLVAMGKLSDAEFGKAGSTTCVDHDGLVKGGAEVTVEDSEGKVVALGRVKGPGEVGDGGLNAPCIFTVDIPDVPAGGRFYRITVGSSGTPFTLKESELSDRKMTVGYGYQS